MLSDRSQTQKAACHIILRVWNVQNRQIHRDGKQTSGCQGLEGLGGKWGLSANLCRGSYGSDKKCSRDFPGGPVVKGLPFNVGDMVRELKIPHATEQLGPCAATTEPTRHNWDPTQIKQQTIFLKVVRGRLLRAGGGALWWHQNPQFTSSCYWGIPNIFLLSRGPRKQFKLHPSHMHSCSWTVEEEAKKDILCQVRTFPQSCPRHF